MIILVILNVCLMFTIWCNPFSKKHERGQGPFNYIVKELNMSDQQVRAYEQLRNWHHDSIMVLRRQGRELRNDIFDNLKGTNTDSKKVDSLISLVGENQEKIEAVTYFHFKQVRALCNEEQKRKFDNIINDVIGRMMQEGPAPGHRDGPPGHEDGPPPPPER